MKIVWTFPKDAVKGYGRFTNVTPSDPNGGDPDGIYRRFVGDPDHSANTSVTYDSTFTADDQDMDFTQTKDHITNTF